MFVYEYCTKTLKEGNIINARSPYNFTPCGVLTFTEKPTEEEIEKAFTDAKMPADAVCVSVHFE